MNQENNPLHDSFFREVQEDVQREQLEKIWKKYGTLIVVVFVAALFAATGFETWKAWYDDIKQKDSLAYENAMTLIEENKIDDALVELEKLSKKGVAAYKIAARFEKAGLLIKNDNRKEGLEILESIAKDKKIDLAFVELASIKLANHLLDDESFDEKKIVDLIEPLSSPNSPWRAQALEVYALLEIKKNNYSKALTYLNRLTSEMGTPQDLRARAAELSSLIMKNKIAKKEETKVSETEEDK